jgi:hypothetical protein
VLLAGFYVPVAAFAVDEGLRGYEKYNCGMSEAKEAWIRALEESADALEKVVGNHELPGPYDIEGIRASMSDKNFAPKWRQVHHVEGFRSRAASLRRGNVKEGDWPPFLPDEATRHVEGLER